MFRLLGNPLNSAGVSTIVSTVVAAPVIDNLPSVVLPPVLEPAVVENIVSPNQVKFIE